MRMPAIVCSLPVGIRCRRWSIGIAIALGLAGSPLQGDEVPTQPPLSIATGRPAPLPDKDYEQWREAHRGAQATPPEAIHVPPGYRVELLRSAQSGESSWVSMAIDPAGRILLGKEGTGDGQERGILRLTLAKNDAEAPLLESIDDTLQECRGLVCAFDSLYARCNKASTGRPTGLYRLRDTDGNGSYDEVRLLRAEGGSGHGINDLVLGPDNRLYLIQGDDSKLPADWNGADSRVQHFGNDQLFVDLETRGTPVFQRPPPGYLVRTDAEGQTWEVLAAGLRNPFGIDFNTDGELFTYDADMEWHVGLPFYRPTHLVHLVSGIDYGWRSGTRPWPFYYPERPPINLAIGLGSPTAVKFGTHSRFPEQYRRALFILDWAYGRILAIHMRPDGASYACASEEFIDGRPLNVTDLEFGPDGAMYFITGGRQTQSGLYRVRYVGGEGLPPAAAPEKLAITSDPVENAQRERAAAARAERRALEAFHGREDAAALAAAWPYLSSADPWLRCAARVAVEAQPVAQWQARALAEQEPTAALTALLALARTAEPSVRPALLERLDQFSWTALGDEQRLLLLRAYQLAFIRLGQPDTATAARIAARLMSAYPAGSVPLDRELCQLLVYLHAPDVVAKTVPLAAAAELQIDRLFYLEMLCGVADGWTRDTTASYFQSLALAKRERGGRTYPQYVKIVEESALARLSAGERLSLAALLEPPRDEPPAPTAERPVVRDWTLADLAGRLKPVDSGRNYQRGREMFTAATCKACHQVGNVGTLVGPDLTNVSRRFSTQDILRSILEPSLAIDEKYRSTVVTTTGGRTVTGTLVDEDPQQLVLSPSALTTELVRIAKSDVEDRRLSPVSPMPAGLLRTLSEEEIFDLLAFIVAGGDALDARFQPPK